MANILDRQQVLLAAANAEGSWIRSQFTRPPLDQWDLLDAETLERVRFLLQHNACDALLVDESLQGHQTGGGLAWLVKACKGPVVYLSGDQPEGAAVALAQGVQQWMPRDLALSYPALLDALLRRAIQSAALVTRAQQSAAELRECRRQANRLVSLLWETSTGEVRTRWFSQRQMMERFQEEVARTERHGNPLTLVLGELRTSPAARLPPDAGNLLETWAAEQITRTKRRADVAGQYGPNGFMLLLVHTSEHGANAFCQRLQCLLEQSPGTSSGPPVPSRAYFGVAGYSSTAFTPKILLSRAEEVLDQMKNAESAAVN
jgi:diguanylate cyclase (GGDEF)-like protein